MTTPLYNVSKLNILIFLFPILYLVHDIEEVSTVEKFLANHSDVIPFSITTAQFAFAFILLWSLTLLGCYQALHQKRFLGMSSITFFSFLVPGIFLANGIGHLLQFIFFQSYVPGVVTSVLIIYNGPKNLDTK